MRCFLAAVLLCLAVPAQAEAKPSRDLSGEFRGDRWIVAQAGTTAADVTRTMRCPPPHCSRNVIKRKWKKKRRIPAPGVVSPVVKVAPIPTPTARPADAPEADAEAAAANAAWERIAESLKPRMGLLDGLAREIGRAMPPTLSGYIESLFRPIGNCREFETLDSRVKQIVADAARHFGGPALMTSCYRSAAYNRRVYARMGRRATKSLHIARKAVDFKIAGVSKFEIARFARRHRLAGGVGLYCNSIVHVDVGRRRDWNWCGGTKRTRIARRIPKQQYASVR